MNIFINNIFLEMNKRKINYCHWKSNNNLGEALDGIDDLDILIAEESIDLFSGLLSEKGFKQASEINNTNTPFVYHFYGIDPITGILIHFHVYYKFVTGGSILKNHWIPIERMFLSEIHHKEQIPTPSREADLILFIIRKFLEQPSLIEHFLFCRDYNNIKKELNWLLEDCDINKVNSLLLKWLPCLRQDLFMECLDALKNDVGIFKRFILGCKIRHCFTLTIKPPIIASLIRSIEFFKAYIKGKLKIKAKNRVLFPGGKLIAFVGSEASGKSTLSADTARWFEKFCNVYKVHLGKPPKTIYTIIPYSAIKIYSLCKKIFSISKKNNCTEIGGSSNPLDYEPHPIIAVLDAIDRYQLLLKCIRKMMKGTIIFTDRYPSKNVGALDSARVNPKGKFTEILARIERKFYLATPNPNLIFKVMAPLDITLQRNSERKAPEPENFVKFRYEKAKKINFEDRMIIIDTTRSLEETKIKVRNIAWFGRNIIKDS